MAMESRSGYDMVPAQHSPGIGQTHVGLGSYGYRLPSSSAVGPDHASDTDSRKDIGDILQQIMTITDQSLDEAQARWVKMKNKLNNVNQIPADTSTTVSSVIHVRYHTYAHC